MASRTNCENEWRMCVAYLDIHSMVCQLIYMSYYINDNDDYISEVAFFKVRKIVKPNPFLTPVGL